MPSDLAQGTQPGSGPMVRGWPGPGAVAGEVEASGAVDGVTYSRRHRALLFLPLKHTVLVPERDPAPRGPARALPAQRGSLDQCVRRGHTRVK